MHVVDDGYCINETGSGSDLHDSLGAQRTAVRRRQCVAYRIASEETISTANGGGVFLPSLNRTTETKP